MSDDTTRQVGDKVLAQLGFAPTDLLHQRLGRVVQNRMSRLGQLSLAEYLHFVQEDAEEMGKLAEALTINETYLFREPKHFDALRKLLPEIAKTTDTVRILSAACASGEEAYSLAITASRSLSALGQKFEVVGVDIDGNVLNKARAGLYGRWSFRDEGFTHANGFVRPEGDRWRIVPRIRELVHFEQVNLVNGAPKGPFHVIFCRNMLMYLTSENRQIVINRLLGLLPPGGAWFIGSSETMETVPPQIERVSSAGTYFYRKHQEKATSASTTTRTGKCDVRILIVTKSPMFRVVVRQVLGSEDGLAVAGEAQDLDVAAEQAATSGIDMIVTDVVEYATGSARTQRPRRSVPVLTVIGADADAAGLGLDVVRMEGASPTSLRTAPQALVAKVRVMSQRTRRSAITPGRAPAVHVRSGHSGGTGLLGPKFSKLLLIGCSTGGPAAATQVLTGLPTGLGLAVLIVQHMPAGFTTSFAERLNRLTQYTVSEASSGAALLADTMYVAPGGKATLVRAGGAIQVAPHDASDVYVPNINRTFHSVAAAGLSSKTLAIVLTGMGDDGATGLAALQAAGADTIVQNPDEAVVPGMVKASIALGAGKRVLLLDEMPQAVVRFANASSGSRVGAGVRAGQIIESRSR